MQNVGFRSFKVCFGGFVVDIELAQVQRHVDESGQTFICQSMVAGAGYITGGDHNGPNAYANKRSATSDEEAMADLESEGFQPKGEFLQVRLDILPNKMHRNTFPCRRVGFAGFVMLSQMQKKHLGDVTSDLVCRFLLH